ncbi:hypothetical protein M8998_06625 [Sphingobacterium sp. lm-10]|uniref:hypothetical protein n=1 Tax=Sphingobacterium sp. lm-10 TaxID=2944904 RepID=UPI002021253A|nr:hypothetical protein [Sphingobacterium sp. lm-10]MCL7987608.1 hypothetical protein [Sphingobacterium sp. lm-10]
MLLPLFASYILLLYGVLRQVIYNHPLGDKPVSDIHLITFTICCGLFLLLLNNIRAELKITKEGFYLSTLSILPSDLSKWSAVREIRVENYKPIREIFGIGFRSMQTNMAYLGGRQPGIKLLLHNGDRKIFAARDQEKLISILTELQVLTSKNN